MNGEAGEARRAARGNRTQAARLLGISRRALLYKLKGIAASTQGGAPPTQNEKLTTDT